MMNTPFGAIRILADGAPAAFSADSHFFDSPMTREWPLAGCYRIRARGKRIRCVLEGADDGMGSSGEGYQAVEFVRESRALTIGTETDREDRMVSAQRDGITVEFPADGEAVFGIAWAEDHRGSDDARTWFAADPTLD